MGNVFADAETRPDRALIGDALGDALPVWDALVDRFMAAGGEVAWRHYRDGGWLAKITRQGTTIAWASVEPGTIRVSFHFAQRLRQHLLDSPDLGDALQERIANAPIAGKTLSLPLSVRTPEALAEVEQLIAAKLSLK